MQSYKEELLEKALGRTFWEAVFASGITFFFFKDNIKEAIIFAIVFVFIFFAIIILLEPFFNKKYE